jgi:hypothetical protein
LQFPLRRPPVEGILDLNIVVGVVPVRVLDLRDEGGIVLVPVGVRGDLVLVAGRLPLLNEQERSRFEDAPFGGVSVFPEIGTRAFLRAVVVTDENGPPEAAAVKWIVVQPGRYRYTVEPDGLMVRMVLSEYLACVVAWE